MAEPISGLFLKARKRKRISIEKASRETKIKKEYLTAIEKGSFDELPGEIYVRSFLNKYAQYLGIKPEKVRPLYHEKMPPPGKKQLKLPYSDFSFRHRRKSWLGLLILLLVLAVVMARVSRVRKKTSPPEPLKVLTGEPAARALRLKIKVIKDCRLQIKEGHEIIFDGNLTKNEEKNWQTDGQFTLKIDDAAGIELAVNDNFIGPVGKDGEYIPALVITPEEIYFAE